MSQNKLENDSAGAVPVRIALQPDAAPANDIDCGRIGPLGLSRTYWMLWCGMLLNRLGGTIFLLLGLYLTRERGLTPELAGLIISLYAAGGLLAGPIGGTSADRFGRRPSLLVGTAGSGAFMLALGFARSTAAIVAIAPVLGFFTDACRAPLQAAVADVVPPRDRARAYGLLYWAMNLGFAAAASFGGALAAHHFGLLFVIDALTTFGYGAFVLFGVPETRPPPRLAATLAATTAPRRMLDLPLHDAGVREVRAHPDAALAGVRAGARHAAARHAGARAGHRPDRLAARAQRRLHRARATDRPAGLCAASVTCSGSSPESVLTALGLGMNAFAGRGHLVYVLAAALWTAGEIGVSSSAPALVADFAPADRRGAYQGTYQLAWAVAMTAGADVGVAGARPARCPGALARLSRRLSRRRGAAPQEHRPAALLIAA